MHCNKCKQEIDSSSVYCKNCGHKIENVDKLNKEDELDMNNSVRKVTKSRSKQNIVVGIVIFVIIGLIYSMTNSDKIKSVSKEELENIDFTMYFPVQRGTIKQYRMGGDKGLDERGKEINIASKKYNGTYEAILENYSPLLDGNKLGDDFYIISKDKILIRDSTISQGRKGKVILSKNPVQEYEEHIEYITSVDKTVETKAGIFEGCIEITTQYVTGMEDWDEKYIKSYFAPNLGTVLTILVDDVKSEDKTNLLYELIDYKLPNNKTSNSQMSNNKESYAYKNNGVEKNKRESINITNNKSNIIVEDTEFDFSIKLPLNWTDKYIISKESTSKYNIDLGNTYMKTLDFLYTPQGLEPQYMFSLVIFDAEILDGLVEDEAQEIRGNSVIVNDKYYIECFTVPEPTQEIVNKAELLSEMMVMVNEDLPNILKTAKFTR